MMSTLHRRWRSRAVLRGLERARDLQDRLLQLLGSGVESRVSLVSTMLERNAHEATSYWLQLVVAMGIATLGLVVGSVAVIIGAMLVAPLMGPIIALAMGLATGSPFLVLRSAGRIVLSVAAVVVGAAAITLLLPFHELNAEIAARTSPTVLDLLTAGFCALAGVYASLRPGSDTASTAAGTSIGISLVPPLCVCGYGLGTELWRGAGGAALLFLTNLVAIIVVGTLSFVAAGFNRVDVTGLERVELAKSQKAVVTAAIARRLAGLFESKAGPALRFFMPLVFLAAVYAPLRRALDEVAWEVRVRAAVQQVLGRQQYEIVQSRVRVERHEADVLVVLIGTAEDAEAQRAELKQQLASVSAASAQLSVFAIPDARALAGLQSTLLRARSPVTLAPPIAAPAPPPPSPLEQLDASRRLVEDTVTRSWPSSSAGEPLLIEIGSGNAAPMRLEVAHIGAPLGAAAEESLARSIGASLGREVRIVDQAIPSAPITRAEGDLRFVSRVSAGMLAAAAIDEVSVCVTQPPSDEGGKRQKQVQQPLAELLNGLFADHPRVTIAPGQEWTVRFERGPCSNDSKPAREAH